MMYIWPPIDAIITQRQFDVQHGIERARAAEDELKNAHSQSVHIIQQANEKADSILREAKADALLLAEQMQAEAVDVKKRIVEDAQKIITNEKNIARNELKKEVVSIAIIMVEKMLHARGDIAEKMFLSALHDIDEKSS